MAQPRKTGELPPWALFMWKSDRGRILTLRVKPAQRRISASAPIRNVPAKPHYLTNISKNLPIPHAPPALAPATLPNRSLSHPASEDRPVFPPVPLISPNQRSIENLASIWSPPVPARQNHEACLASSEPKNSPVRSSPGVASPPQEPLPQRDSVQLDITALAEVANRSRIPVLSNPFSNRQMPSYRGFATHGGPALERASEKTAFRGSLAESSQESAS
jgi:hypothetical protein